MPVSRLNGLNSPVNLVKPNPVNNRPNQVHNPNDNSNPYHGGDNFNSTASTITNIGLGALSGYKYHGTVMGAGKNFGNAVLTGGFKDVVGAIKTNTKVLGETTVNAIGVSALLGGSISAVTNVVSLAKGNQTSKEAAANVIGDTLSSALSGGVGAMTGGATALALSAFKVTGTPLIIGGVVGGAVGATLVSKFVDFEGLKRSIAG